MSWTLPTLSIIIYLLNHKKNCIKRLPVLMTIFIVVTIIFYYFFKDLNLYDAYNFLGIAGAIDNLIYIYEKRNKEKNKN